MSNVPNKNLDYTTGFHVWPNNTVQHLHMHVIYKPFMNKVSYKKETSPDKFIETETLINALSSSNELNKNPELGMSVKVFKERQGAFKTQFTKLTTPKEKANFLNGKRIPALQFKGGMLFDKNGPLKNQNGKPKFKGNSNKGITNTNTNQIFAEHENRLPGKGYAFPYSSYYGSPKYKHEDPAHWFPNISGHNLTQLNKSKNVNTINLSTDPKLIIFLNRDKVTTGSTSIVHLLVIPHKYYFNAIELNGRHVDMVKKMKKEGIKAAQYVVEQIERITRITKNTPGDRAGTTVNDIMRNLNKKKQNNIAIYGSNNIFGSHADRLKYLNMTNKKRIVQLKDRIIALKKLNKIGENKRQSLQSTLLYKGM